MILVDSNIWIFANIQEYPEHPVAVKMLKEYEKEAMTVNSIIFSEVFHKLSVLLGRSEADKRTRKTILDSDFVFYMELQRSTLEKSLSLASKLRINDALIAQHAIDLKMQLLTDNVKDFTKVENLKVLPLR